MDEPPVVATTPDPFEGLLGGHEPTCTWPDILSRLRTDEHRAALKAAAAKTEREVPSSRIERALRAEGIPVSRPKVEKHRAGLCDCGE